MRISAVDLFVILAIVHFSYLATKLFEMVKKEIEPDLSEEWASELHWKDQ